MGYYVYIEYTNNGTAQVPAQSKEDAEAIADRVSQQSDVRKAEVKKD